MTGAEEVAITSSAPHDFAPLVFRDRFGSKGRCRHCYMPKGEHPVTFWAQSRPLGPPGPPQRTFIYCPNCGLEMVAGGNWLGQHLTTMYEGYRCARCGTESVWNFDLPAPAMVRHSDD